MFLLLSTRACASSVPWISSVGILICPGYLHRCVRAHLLRGAGALRLRFPARHHRTAPESAEPELRRRYTRHPCDTDHAAIERRLLRHTRERGERAIVAADYADALRISDSLARQPTRAGGDVIVNW